MNCKYTIKNFRVFDEKGATFNLCPITILTGCNNSGKSSLVKSLLVFLDYVKHVAENSKTDSIRMEAQKILFNLPNINLGFFENILNCNHKENKISFEISLYSHILYEELSLLMNFGYTEEVHNGTNIELLSITLKNKDNTILYEANNYKYSEYVNINYLMNKCLVFSLAEFDYGKQYLQKEIPYQKFVDLASSVKDTKISKTCSQKVLLQMYDKKIYYYLPIYDKLFKMEKIECINYINNLVANEKLDNTLVNLTQIILNDLSKSQCASLEDYIRTWEKDYFNKISNHALCMIGQIDETIFSSLYIFDDQNLNEISYRHIYTVFASLSYFNNLCNHENDMLEIVKVDDGIFIFDKREKLFCKWFDLIFPEIFIREIPYSLNYVDPTNIIQKKVYSIDTTDTMSDILNKYINLPSCKYRGGKDNITKGTFINEWIKKLGLGETISICKDEEGVGVYIKLHKSTDDYGTLLIYNGSGVFQIVLLLIRIETSIFSQKERDLYWNKKLKRMHDDFIPYKITKSTISLVEPEAHLHPYYQSQIADIIIDAYNNYNIDFVIETHSEYLIRRLQSLVAQKKLDRNDAIIYYMYDSKQDDIPEYVDKVKEIKINEDGSLTDSFGSGFFDESYNLSNELLKVKLGLL